MDELADLVMTLHTQIDDSVLEDFPLCEQRPQILTDGGLADTRDAFERGQSILHDAANQFVYIVLPTHKLSNFRVLPGELRSRF